MLREGFDRYLAAEHEPPERGGQDVGVRGGDQPEAVGIGTEQEEQGLHAALGVQPAIPLPRARLQRGHVVHELGLRERGGVASGEAQRPYIRQRHGALETVLRVVRHGVRT